MCSNKSYTASQAETATLEKIGSGSTDKIIEFLEAALARDRDPITAKDLTEIRLPEEYWQNLIDTGVISLTMPPAAKPRTILETTKDDLVTNADFKELQNNTK